MSPAPSVDILIVGAGPAGLTLALALADSGHSMALVDAGEPERAARDPRVLALSHGSRLMFERLGIWGRFPATPITEIHVSQQAGFGRTLIRADELQVPALGYVASAARIAEALRSALAAKGVRPSYATRLIADADTASGQVRVVGPAGETTLDARLVVHAEGGAGTGTEAGQVSVRDYRQHAIVTDIEPARPHGGRAWERFTPGGPVALLPFGERYSLVYTCASTEVDACLGSSESAFIERVEAHFAGRLRFVGAGARQAFPLAMRRRREPVSGRHVWLGNAAQTLHPVAGQGFNLALRDIAVLTECLVRERELDGPMPGLLRDFARARRVDRLGAQVATDGLARLFVLPGRLAASMRGFGLLALDLCPPMRGILAGRAMFGLCART